EPGNDMDTDMLAIMEDLLDSWPGTLILVSHDRYLMERVTDHQFALMDGKIRHLPGGVDEFLKLVEERDKTRGAAVSAGMPGAAGESAPAPAAAASGLTRQEEYQLKKQLASVERKLDSARKKVEEAKAGLLTIAGADFVALGKQQEKVDAAQEVVDELEMEWLELSEKLEA
ncbi:MAG: ABC transporter ATP-binding protein, partial [Coriobacteriia bacterium]|nr:ABC transporter ATP-binding protein [Coriobacteriia bacterium]